MSEEQDKKTAEPDKAEKSVAVTASDKSSKSDSSKNKSSTDTTAASAKHSTTQHAHRKRKSARKQSSGWGVVILIVIALLAGGGWFSYDRILNAEKTFDEIQQSQVALTEQNRDFEASLLARMETMQTQQNELTEYIQVLRDKNQHLRKDWLIMEAEYLIQLSNYRLLFERDINTAIAALDSADVRLRDTGDPGILAVRKVIAEAVQALKQVPQADLAGLSLTLSAINKDIEKMPLSTPDPKSKKHEQQHVEQETKNVKSWQDLPAAIWSDLKGLVEIRDHEAPIQPLLSPEERFFLIENLRLQIEQARLAMLSGQAKVYQERLSTAIGWIEQHFDKQSAITKSTLAALKTIQAESIAPALPDISNTYQALRDYRLGREPITKPDTPSEPEQTTTPADRAPAEQDKPASAAGAS